MRLRHPDTTTIYNAEMSLRAKVNPFTSVEEAQHYLRKVLLARGFPQAEEAYVIDWAWAGKSAVSWDHGTVPPTPGIAMGTRMRDRVTVLHESAHLVTSGEVQKSLATSTPLDPHGPQFLAAYEGLLREFLPHLAAEFHCNYRRETLTLDAQTDRTTARADSSQDQRRWSPCWA